MTAPFSAPTIKVTVTKAIPANVGANLTPPISGAQLNVGSVLQVKQNDAITLVRGGYAQEGTDTATGVGGSTGGGFVIVTVIKAIPASVGAALNPPISGAQLNVNSELTVRQNDAITLVRGGYAYFQEAADTGRANTGGAQAVHSGSLDFPSVAAGAAAALTINAMGAALGDPVIVGAPATLPAGIIPVGFVSAANVVTIRIENQSAAAVDLPAGTWKVALVKLANR